MINEIVAAMRQHLYFDGYADEVAALAADNEILREAWVDGKMREDRDALLIERDALAARLAEAEAQIRGRDLVIDHAGRMWDAAEARLAEAVRLLEEIREDAPAFGMPIDRINGFLVGGYIRPTVSAAGDK